MPGKEGRTGNPGNSTTYHKLEFATSNLSLAQPTASRSAKSHGRTGTGGNKQSSFTGRTLNPGNDVGMNPIDIAASKPSLLQPSGNAPKRSSVFAGGNGVPSWERGKFKHKAKGGKSRGY